MRQRRDIAEFSAPGVAEETTDNEATTVDDADVSVAETDVDPDSNSTEAAASDEFALISEDAITPIAEDIDLPEAIDWTALPAPDIMVTLANPGGEVRTSSLTIREDTAPATIDFLRDDATEALSIVLTESDFSGSRSPLESGQYSLENNGEVTFAAGQDRVRTTISVRSNPVREADRDVTLLVSTGPDSGESLASLQLTLEDDDQRAFEASLPPNTVAFAVSQISVQESDPAAQIDVVRYRADNTTIQVPYELVDVTASEGQDYFAPSIGVIEFGPGQRTARILIPLGQDARPESDEAFMLELQSQAAPTEAKLFSQIAVMIRDDDT